MREILYNVESQRQQKVEDPEELVEEQIAEVLSGEAELLKEHNIIGYRIQIIMTLFYSKIPRFQGQL